MLGGGDPNDAFAAAHGAAVKALIPVAGEPMAWHVLAALHLSGRIGRVAYIGPTTPKMDGLIDLRVTDHGSLIANLEAGLLALEPHLQPGEQVLVITADIPMLTPEQVRELLQEAPEAALLYPIVSQQACEAAYPGVQRTVAKLREGTFTGGNIFLCDPQLVRQFMPRLRDVLAARKQPLKLAAMIGPSVLVKLLAGNLSITELEQRVSRILGVSARAFITPHAAIGTDIDKDSDLELAERVLGAKAGA